MDDVTRRENEHFEDEVRRIARELWPSAEFSGSTIVDGRERDGVFETEDCIHVVEATTSRRKDKAKEDIAKLTSLLAKLRRRSGTKAVRGWWVTSDEPTADQRKISDKHRDSVNTLSFSQFQARLIDSHAYHRKGQLRFRKRAGPRDRSTGPGDRLRPAGCREIRYQRPRLAQRHGRTPCRRADSCAAWRLWRRKEHDPPGDLSRPQEETPEGRHEYVPSLCEPPRPLRSIRPSRGDRTTREINRLRATVSPC